MGLTEEKFEKLIDVEAKYFYHYPNLLAFLRKASFGVYILAKLNIIPKSTYSNTVVNLFDCALENSKTAIK